jgi:type VI secretion system Hcp family effector
MAGNAFIALTAASGKVLGEATQTNHVDQVEIGDFSWEVTSDTSFTKGGGASVGKATPGVCTWKHFYDTASPMIMLNCVQGTTFSTVVLYMCKNTGNATPDVYFTMTMSMCYITKATIEAGEDGSVNQGVEMVFKNCKIEYKKQLNDTGKLDTTPKSFTWDIPTMKATV